MPFSISTFCCVGMPSSSTLSDPRRLPMVPSSITVQRGLATCWPMRPLNAETPLRLKSASRPWPTASCSRIPGHPGPEHDSHFARRRLDRAQLHDGLPRGFLREMLRRFFVQEKIERHAPAAAGIAVLRSAVGLREPAPSRSCAPWAGDRNSAGLRWSRPARGAGCRRRWPAPETRANRRRARLDRRA